MSLRDITKDKHTEAESTAFMKAVFDNKMPLGVWADFTFNKMLFYRAIEGKARREGFLDDLEGIDRAELLRQDFFEMNLPAQPRANTIEYLEYLQSLKPGLILAHLYTWHMGDLHGGQMIKKMIDAPHHSLEFEDRIGLINRLRAKLDDGLGDEANIAFDWAIRIMKDYDDNFGI